jgi:hypothetical protein
LTGKLLAGIELPLPAPIRLEIISDWRLLLYSALLTAVATIVCGLLPVWQSFKVSITPDLAREGKSRLRSLLVVAQIASSVVVLISGFLFVGNLVRANSISPGFDVRHTLLAQINLSRRAIGISHRKRFIRRSLERIGSAPRQRECSGS